MKLRHIAAAAALTFAASVASAQQAKPAAAPAAASTPAPDKNTVSYAFGYSLGAELARSGEAIDIATVVKGVQDAYAKKNPTYTEQQMEAAYGAFQQRMQAKVEQARKQALADNQTKSAGFVTQYKAQQGVVTLPSGLMYRVIEAGKGNKVASSNEVELAFQTFLAAVGVPISSVQQPRPFKASEAPISALKETLPLMQPGAAWEVLLPPGKGDLTPQDKAQFANQAILMQFKLLNVK